MIGRGGMLAAVIAAALMGGGSIPVTRREAQPPAKPTSNRKALALEKALRRRARWDRQG